MSRGSLNIKRNGVTFGTSDEMSIQMCQCQALKDCLPLMFYGIFPGVYCASLNHMRWLAGLWWPGMFCNARVVDSDTIPHNY
jgi:hypothetical protein